MATFHHTVRTMPGAVSEAKHLYITKRGAMFATTPSLGCHAMGAVRPLVLGVVEADGPWDPTLFWAASRS
jgi:hypothetical protein